MRRLRTILLHALLGAALIQSAASAQGWSRPAPEEEPVLQSELEGDALAARLAEIDAQREVMRRREENKLRSRTMRYMEEAQELLDDGQAEAAYELVDSLNLDRLNDHERAFVHRYKGYVAYTDGDMETAIQQFRKAIEQEILPLSAETNMRFSIAQLYASLQNWDDTIAAIEEWLRWELDPDPLGYYLLAIAHFQKDDFDQAIANAEKAIDLADKPKEGWLQLLAALYVGKEDYASAAPVLEELVLRFPKRIYWVQLSLIYGAREQYKRSLAVQQVAHAQGLLTDDKELRRLARSYLHADLPYPAAQVLAEGIEDGLIEKDQEAFELLANSWIAAREYDKSLEPLRRAAELSEDGKLFIRLGQVYLQRENWREAAKALERAIEKGSLQNPGNALLLLGIANYNDERVGSARTYFTRALRHEDTRPQAENWLQHLDNEARAAGTADAGAPTPPA